MQRPPSTSLPFPLIPLTAGAVPIVQLPVAGLNTDPAKGPCNAANSNCRVTYSSPLDVVSGELGSLFAMANEGEALDVDNRKKQCDDAFAVHLTEDYPYVIIADGGFNSCHPYQIPQIVNDAEINREILAFKNKIQKSHLEINEDARKLMQTIADICKKKYPYDRRPSLFSMSIAVPFISSDGITKVVSFGIGNDEIYKIGPLDLVTQLRGSRPYFADKDGNLALNGSLDYGERVDKILMPAGDGIRKKLFDEALRLMAVTVEDFNEGDQLFATTDGLPKIVNDYNDAIDEASELPESKGLGDVKEMKWEELITFSCGEIAAVIQRLHQETVRINDQNYLHHNAELQALNREFRAVNEEFTAIESKKSPENSQLTEKQRELSEILKANNEKTLQLKRKMYYKTGDDYAFCHVTLTPNLWEKVATSETLLKIINDTTYWKTKTVFGKEMPQGVTNLQTNLKTLGRLDIKALKVIADQRQYHCWTYWLSTRKYETQYLYNILTDSDKTIPLSQNEDFQRLFTDWAKHQGPQRMAEFKLEAEVAVRQNPRLA